MAIKPKLALIPSGVKASKVYSVLPSDGTGDFTFDRNLNTATRINKDGLIEMVDADVPRLNYPLIDGVVSGCPSLLLEPESRNLVQYSEDFSQSIWNKLTNSTATANVAISPDGTQNSSEIKAVATSTSLLGVQDAFTVSSGVSYTISFFAKKGVARYIQLFNGGGQITGNPRTNFDLEDGVVTVSDANHTATIEDYGNGWFRCIVELSTVSTTLQTYFNAVKEPSALRSVISDWSANDNFYIWGVQLEQGSYVSSYIPSLTGSQTTRSAETCNNAGNDQVINSTEGVLYIETSALSNDLSERRFGISDGTSSNVVRVGYTSTSNRIIAVVYNGSNQAVLTYTSSDITKNSKIAFKYKENDFALWVDGQERSTDTFGSVFPTNTLNSLDFNVGGGSHFYSNTKEVKIYNKALSDAELQALTTI